MNNILQLPTFIKTINEINLFFDDFVLDEKKAKDNYTRSNEKDIAFQLKVLDQLFFESDYRKQNYYVKQIRPRTIINTIGTVNFNRRQYQSKHSNEYYFFIDSILNLAPYKRLSWELINQVLKKVTVDSY